MLKEKKQVKNTSPIRLGPTPKDFIFTNYICNSPISKEGHSEVLRIRNSAYFSKNKIQPIIPKKIPTESHQEVMPQ